MSVNTNPCDLIKSHLKHDPSSPTLLVWKVGNNRAPTQKGYKAAGAVAGRQQGNDIAVNIEGLRVPLAVALWVLLNDASELPKGKRLVMVDGSPKALTDDEWRQWRYH